MEKNKCVFCSSVDKETIIYQDQLCFAIVSHSPINDYHVLVIPYEHYEDFTELPDVLASHIFLVAKKLSNAVRNTCRPDAISHLSDDDISKNGFNLVSHYKFHIIPRFKNDHVKIDWGRKPDQGIKYRQKIAEEIKVYVDHE